MRNTSSLIVHHESRQMLPLSAFVVGLAIFGFHFNNIVNYALFGRGGGTGISFELLTSLPLVLYVVAGWKLLTSKLLSRIVLYTYVVFSFWIFLGAWFVPPASTRLLITPMAHIFVLCGSAYLFYQHWQDIKPYLAYTLLFVIMAFNIWVLFIWLDGQVTTGSYLGITRRNFAGLLSTEITMLLGSQLCYLLFLFVTAKNIWQKTSILALLMINILLVFFAGARAPIGGVVLILVLFFSVQRIQQKLIYGLMVLIAVLITYNQITPYFDIITTSSQSFFTGEDLSTRTKIYDTLVYLIEENPQFGIGYGNFPYYFNSREELPTHQNILGRAAENGIPAAGLYTLFILLVFLALNAKSNNYEHLQTDIFAKWFILACLWIFVFQQFRGMFQDTWNLKEIFFVVGSGMGLKIRLMSSAGREAIADLSMSVAKPINIHEQYSRKL